MNELTKIAQIINNGMNLLGRKIDSLAMELRRKSPTPASKISVDIGDNVTKGVSDAIKESIAGLEMPKFEGFPEFPKYPEYPEPKAPIINIPEIKLPVINVPETVVNVPAPQVTVQPTPVTFPSQMKVEGMDKLIEGVNREREIEDKNIFEEITSKSPLAVMIVDKKGKQINDFGGEFSAPNIVSLKVGTTAVGESNPLPVTTDGFAIPMFDQQVIDETLAPATTVITYKRDGVTVATKTITVAGSITTITVT